MRWILAAASVLFASVALAPPGRAQENYPSRPLRLIVPFAPGGSTDIFARLVGERLAAALGQPVLIDNRAGAGGNIGAEAVARAAPDGYTLLMATTGVMAINPFLYRTLSYDPAKDLEPVILIATITNVLIVAPEFPARSVAELLAAARREPGKLSFASSGAGSSTHMSAELFKSMTGTEILHVPYKGSGQALPDLMAGRVTMMFENMPGAIAFIRAGKLRALAVTGLKRSSALPEVPTVAESGVPGYDSLSWSGLAVPAGTPRQVIQRLNKESAAILASADLRAKLAEQGGEPAAGPPEQFVEHVRAEREKWGRLIRERGIVVN
ncbi:MAG: tripartite tricarboxylate transporter substrate binding protein [Betaproteobacteria bacterium]|nr:tripartite tricarboxylate transporter substrate binding protein [Betaproteobacteria bacterium]